MTLAAETCKACEGEEAKLSSKEVLAMLPELDGWEPLEMEHKLYKDFEFKNFAEALRFVTQVSSVAEQQNHHPDITFGWCYAEIVLTTHATGGLSRNDFILAAKIDGLQAK